MPSTAVAVGVALMIGNAVIIAVGEPVAAAVLLVTRARHRKGPHSPRRLAIARPLTGKNPQLRNMMKKMSNPQLRKMNSDTAVRHCMRAVGARW